GVEEEGDNGDVVMMVDRVGVGKSTERGTGMDSKDGMMGKGGIDVDKVGGSNEVDEVNVGVESMMGVDVDIKRGVWMM
ncbi:hypothetical protein KI387_039675, partial [Taxus chinensis]